MRELAELCGVTRAPQDCASSILGTPARVTSTCAKHFLNHAGTRPAIQWVLRSEGAVKKEKSRNQILIVNCLKMFGKLVLPHHASQAVFEHDFSTLTKRLRKLVRKILVPPEDGDHHSGVRYEKQVWILSIADMLCRQLVEHGLLFCHANHCIMTNSDAN